jgi:anti-anti-sigma factor
VCRDRAAPSDLPAGGRPFIAITKEGDVVTAALAGDFDMQATFTVEPALERALETPGLRRIELDLRGLEFIDSTGMGVIVRLDREARGRGVQLVCGAGRDRYTVYSRRVDWPTPCPSIPRIVDSRSRSGRPASVAHIADLQGIGETHTMTSVQFIYSAGLGALLGAGAFTSAASG